MFLNVLFICLDAFYCSKYEMVFGVNFTLLLHDELNEYFKLNMSHINFMIVMRCDVDDTN